MRQMKARLGARDIFPGKKHLLNLNILIKKHNIFFYKQNFLWVVEKEIFFFYGGRGSFTSLLDVH